MALNSRGLLVAVLLVAVAVGNASAATYVVGDNFGWGVPANPSDYSTWTSQHVFTVGDVLVFNFVTGVHDVAQVNKAAYDGCSSTTPILLKTEGPWNTTLNSTGDYYYICTFGIHCSLGQKLAINVTASSATPTPAPAPSLPLAPTPAPTPSESPSPSPGSSPTPTPSPGSPPGSSPTPIPSPGSPPGSPPSPSPGTGGATPPPPPPGAPSDGLSPPPPPNTAMLTTISTLVVGFALAVFGLMI